MCEFPKCRFELARKLAKQLDQIQGILQCYGGPLSCARAHGMRGIADKDQAILVPRREAWDLINVNFDDPRCVNQKRPNRVMPSPIAFQQLLTQLLIRNYCQL